MMQHGPGLAASPPVRNNLEVEGRNTLLTFFRNGPTIPLRNSGACPAFRAEAFRQPLSSRTTDAAENLQLGEIEFSRIEAEDRTIQKVPREACRSPQASGKCPQHRGVRDDPLHISRNQVEPGVDAK
jgi:hypothetical protein